MDTWDSGERYSFVVCMDSREIQQATGPVFGMYTFLYECQKMGTMAHSRSLNNGSAGPYPEYPGVVAAHLSAEEQVEYFLHMKDPKRSGFHRLILTPR